MQIVQDRYRASVLAVALSLSSLAGCALSSDGADSGHADDVSEVHQESQSCTSTCSAWGGHTVSCTGNGTCVADANGVTCDAGTAQQQQIACSCSNLSVSLTTNPEGHASNQTVTWTAHPTGGSGNYTYTWVETWCRNGNAPGDCNGSSNTVTSTTPTKSLFSSTYMWWDQYCVTVHDNTCSAYGNSNTVCARVAGDGTCPAGKVCQQ